MIPPGAPWRGGWSRPRSGRHGDCWCWQWSRPAPSGPGWAWSGGLNFIMHSLLMSSEFTLWILLNCFKLTKFTVQFLWFIMYIFLVIYQTAFSGCLKVANITLIPNSQMNRLIMDYKASFKVALYVHLSQGYSLWSCVFCVWSSKPLFVVNDALQLLQGTGAGIMPSCILCWSRTFFVEWCITFVTRNSSRNYSFVNYLNMTFQVLFPFCFILAISASKFV